MQPFLADLETLALEYDDFRHVAFTGMHSQVVAMVLAPGEDIGSERHEDVDQTFLLVRGALEFELDGRRADVAAGGIVVVPAGTQHNVTNVGGTEARLVTIYAPAQHAEGTVHRTKADALRAEPVLPV